MVLLLISVCLSMCLGFLSVFCCLPGKRWVGSELLFGLLLGMICGLGLSSGLFFISYTLLAPDVVPILIMDFGIHVLLIGLFFFLFKSRRHNAIGVTETNVKGFSSTEEGRLSLIFILMCMVAAGTYVLIAMQVPYGGHDALNFWNLRARILALPQASWMNDLKTVDFHADYPLLLGAGIGRGWMYFGSCTVWIPISIHFMVTFATILLLTAAVWRIKGLKPALIAGMLLVGTPHFLRDGAEAQQADVTLSFFVLAAVVLLVWKDLFEKKHAGLPILAGLCAGLAVWTKNEGLLFLVCVVLIRFSLIAFYFGLKDALRELKYFGLGLAPVLLILIYFKFKITATNDLIAGQGVEITFSRLNEFPRYFQILLAFIKEMLSFNRWQIYPVVLGIYLYLSGIDMNGKEKKLAFFSTAGIMTMMIGGYYVVYLTTPLDLQFHLRTSLHRLLLHLWPLSLFAVFVIKRETNNGRPCDQPQNDPVEIGMRQ